MLGAIIIHNKRIKMTEIVKIKNSNDAVVGIVVAVLLIGLVLVIVSTIQLVFIPKWMEQIEAEHMDEVNDQFAQLKFAIDVQTIMKQEDIPLSTPITLGSREFPILKSSKSYGNIEIIPDEFGITFENTSYSNTFSLGIIKYSSSNSYFLDQSHIYEAGSVITGQSTGNIMSIKPTFSVNDPEIYFTLVNITDVGDKKSAGGYGTYPIRIEFHDNASYDIEDIEYINITTDYQNAWYLYFNSTLKNAGLIYGAGDDFTIETIGGTIISIHFNPASNIILYLSTVEIYAQIAPGWIEN
jgi:hypothetical protein